MPLDLASSQALLLDFITGRADGGAASALVLGDERASAGERLHVYAHMYRARLCEALQAIYPRLERHLGPEDFVAVASDYIDAHPSRTPSLRYFGAALAGWLARHRAGALVLAELARLEWARYDVFDAVDERALELEALRALPPEAFADLPLTAIRAHCLLTVEAGTAAAWDVAAAGGDEAVEARERVLVWRQGTAVYHRVVETDEAAALERVATGTTFGAICEALAATHPPGAAAARAFAWLSTWANDGLLLA